MLRPPPNGDPYLVYLVKTLNADLMRREPLVLEEAFDEVPGPLTTDGGLQTFGANDSAGAGYRLVRVPNV